MTTLSNFHWHVVEDADERRRYGCTEEHALILIRARFDGSDFIQYAVVTSEFLADDMLDQDSFFLQSIKESAVAK